MDDLKDNSRGDEFSKFIDAQNLHTDPFGKNRAAERLYRRVERICAAIYILTRHIPQEEPLRPVIRRQSLALFRKVLDLRDEMRATESNSLFAFESSIRRLISLVRILTAAGFVSFQNADIVIGALDELGAFVASSQRSSLSEGVFLTRENIMGDTSPLGDRFFKDVKDRKAIRDRADVTDTHATSSETSSSRVSSGARAQGIMTVLKGGGGLGIRDISARLPDYSEKMIQRELALLIKSGQVKKDGFKRWSKYSLVQG